MSDVRRESGKVMSAKACMGCFPDLASASGMGRVDP